MPASTSARKGDFDVCVLLEGTYPFVRGGVSSWVHQIVSGLSELRFALVFVGGNRKDYAQSRYELPPNAPHLQTHYLEDALLGHSPPSSSRRVKLRAPDLGRLQALHAFFKARGSAGYAPHTDQSIDELLCTIGRRGELSAEQFLFSSGAWQLLRRGHIEGDPQAAFVDYFWTVRLMHAPIFQLARIVEGVPNARVYHTISTGYAGLLGAMLERRRGRPLVLSEHGIYTKERRIDLNQAQWLDSVKGRAVHAGAGDPSSSIRALWIRYFEGLGRLTYRSARPIISLYHGNRERQIADGARPQDTRIIVNGIDVERFAAALCARGKGVPRVVGLIGRVVPIKDVKTFIRTMHIVIRALPDAQGWIIGSAEEDAAYGKECEALVESLGLAGRVRFLGHQDVTEILPRLGLLMLTSISEAQPLAVLEAFAAGVPCVTTDVGACREQIEGRTAEDQALGAAGRVVSFADAEALGGAATELLSDEATWRACQRAGLARVRRYYTQASMLEAYRAVYREALAA